MPLKMKNPRIIFRIAMMCLALFGSFGMVHPTSTVSEDLLDGARGALLGAAIALLYLAFRLERNLKNHLSS